MINKAVDIKKTILIIFSFICALRLLDSYTKLLGTTIDLLCDREVLMVNKYTMVYSKSHLESDTSYNLYENLTSTKMCIVIFLPFIRIMSSTPD